MQFAPWHALLGGLAIGTLSAGKTLLTGRILGISGAFKGLLLGDFKLWRVLFLAGLVVGGAILGSYMPGAFEMLPDTYSFQRAVIAGLTVGAGTGIGNGCTSGHGISGLSRFSIRSLLYTSVFMAAAMLTTAITGTSAALGVPQSAPVYAIPSGDDIVLGLSIVGAAVASTVAIGFAFAKGAAQDTFSNVYEFLAGLLFAFALGFGRMTSPSVVSTFLAVLQPCWNLTLMFVMGGGLLIAAPIFQKLVLPRSTSLSGSPMGCPTSTVIDSKLILGGLLFGFGWGFGGFCPGPALVALGNPQPKVLALCTAMFAGMSAVTVLPKAAGLENPLVKAA